MSVEESIASFNKTSREWHAAIEKEKALFEKLLPFAKPVHEMTMDFQRLYGRRPDTLIVPLDQEAMWKDITGFLGLSIVFAPVTEMTVGIASKKRWDQNNFESCLREGLELDLKERADGM